MKKKSRKLELTRETLKDLNQDQTRLAVAAGTHESVCGCASGDKTTAIL